MAGKACPTCGQKQYQIVKVQEHSDLWGCLNCMWYGYHPKAFRGCKDRVPAKQAPQGHQRPAKVFLSRMNSKDTKGGEMTTEQRKALEEAAFWQARKDGIPYRKAKRLAREAVK